MPHTSRVARPTLRAAIAAALSGLFLVLTIAPAHAAAYRYWGFYQLTDGKWAFAQKGADQTTPADGAVEGWRFAVADENSTRYPRAVLTFDQICSATPAQDGNKRVGIVIDFGRPADGEAAATPPEPKTYCAVVTPESTSADVLAAAGDVRTENGMICGIAAYPASGCGGEVKEVSDEAKAADTPVTIGAPGSGSTGDSTAPSPSGTAVAPTATAPATTDAATPPASAAPTGTATAPAEADSGTNTAAYVIAGLVLLALIIFVVVRSRGRARTDA